MNILFVCTGNTCRSPMAEGILRDLASKRNLDITVKSAGIFAADGGSAAKNAIQVLEDMGIDISTSRSSSISEGLMEESDIILVMSTSHRDSLLMQFPHMEKKTYLLNQYALNINKDIEDPYGGSRLHYEKARDEIYKAIVALIERGKKDENRYR